jgi:hypothetical protein
MSTVHDALQALTDLTPGRQQILTDVVAGLSRTPRQLPSKYFYDARGSRLFEQITQTPSTTPRAPSWPCWHGCCRTSPAASARTCTWWNWAAAVAARPRCCWPPARPGGLHAD